MATLEGKVALVSGAGRGIGKAIAQKLAREGAAIVLNDLDEEPASQAADEIVADGGRAVPCAGSVTDPDFATRYIDTAVQGFGGIDIIINNAGFTWDSVIQKMTDDQWDSILAVHLTAPFRILRAAQPSIAARAKAEREIGAVACRKVVNISSIAGTGGNAGQANYSSAKSGILGLTKTLAKEWGRYNVTVNAVAFGLINTRLTGATSEDDSSIDIQGTTVKLGMAPAHVASVASKVPLGRAGTPEDAAGAVYLMCLPESNYITGQVLICGGGLG
jgi:3-oxoacyl-[acyl-carrier protein] reductase